MGLRSFSMSPAFVPVVKELLKHLTAERAEAILKIVLRMRTTAQIIRFMDEQLADIAPKLTILGS